MPLTDTACKQAKAREKLYKLADSGGLYLEVPTSGSKRWRLKYHYAGKEKRISLGVYPAVTLKQARLLREAAKKQLESGHDPSVLRQEEKLKLSLSNATCFEGVAREWWAHWKESKTERHAAYVLTRLEADVFPVIGAKPINELTAPLILMTVKKIEARGALDIAKRALQTCGQVMRYAIQHGLAERNPCADIKPSDALKPRKKRNFSRIDSKDLPQLLRDIEAYAGSAYTVLALKLMAHTFVRTSELIGARWEEFDTEARLWRIPAERMKMRTPHIVPL